MKLILWLLIFLCPFVSVSQQQNVLPQPGDFVPDVYFENIINSTVSKARLSHFKKKAILIDFWATTCGACIEKLPMLDSMQKVHKNELSVIVLSVTSTDNTIKVNKVLTRLAASGQNIQLPFVISDTVLPHFFPMDYVPHYAWLDSNLKLIAFTGYEDATAQKISAFARGEKVDFLIAENQLGFDSKKPLFINGNGGSGAALLGRSTLTKYIPELHGRDITKDSMGRITHMLISNSRLLELLKIAYDFTGSSTLINYSPDQRESFDYSLQNVDLQISNSFTWELVALGATQREVKDWLKQDIRRYLYYSAETKPIPTRCYILSTDSVKLDQYVMSIRVDNNVLLMEDVADLAERILDMPVINESNFKKTIKLNFPANSITGEKLVKLLATMGVTLTESIRPLNNLFIYHHLPN